MAVLALSESLCLLASVSGLGGSPNALGWEDRTNDSLSCVGGGDATNSCEDVVTSASLGVDDYSAAAYYVVAQGTNSSRGSPPHLSPQPVDRSPSVVASSPSQQGLVHGSSSPHDENLKISPSRIPPLVLRPVRSTGQARRSASPYIRHSPSSYGPSSGSGSRHSGSHDGGSHRAVSPRSGSHDTGSPRGGRRHGGSPDTVSSHSGSRHSGSHVSGSPRAGRRHGGSHDSGSHRTVSPRSGSHHSGSLHSDSPQGAINRMATPRSPIVAPGRTSSNRSPIQTITPVPSHEVDSDGNELIVDVVGAMEGETELGYRSRRSSPSASVANWVCSIPSSPEHRPSSAHEELPGLVPREDLPARKEQRRYSPSLNSIPSSSGGEHFSPPSPSLPGAPVGNRVQSSPPKPPSLLPYALVQSAASAAVDLRLPGTVYTSITPTRRIAPGPAPGSGPAAAPSAAPAARSYPAIPVAVRPYIMPAPLAINPNNGSRTNASQFLLTVAPPSVPNITDQYNNIIGNTQPYNRMKPAHSASGLSTEVNWSASNAPSVVSATQVSDPYQANTFQGHAASSHSYTGMQPGQSFRGLFNGTNWSSSNPPPVHSATRVRPAQGFPVGITSTFGCAKCPSHVFLEAAALRRHNDEFHQNSVGLNCRYCQSPFSNLDKMVIHQKACIMNKSAPLDLWF